MHALRVSLMILVGIAASPNLTLAQSCNSTDRAVLLILDASGSMNAKLPNGETRIAVAQRAVKGVASFIPDEAQLSLRLYGAQSPKAEKNCEDTNLAVSFGPAGASGDAIAATVDAAVAQGYTPIAFTLEQAANDFPADAKERVIVLVSDGKETCEGDPVVAAKALAAKGITVHTVGFIVDTAARGQPQHGGELCTEQARTQNPQRHVGVGSWNGLNGLPWLQGAEESLQLQHILQETIGCHRVNAQSVHRLAIGAGRSTQS